MEHTEGKFPIKILIKFNPSTQSSVTNCLVCAAQLILLQFPESSCAVQCIKETEMKSHASSSLDFQSVARRKISIGTQLSALTMISVFYLQITNKFMVVGAAVY